MDSESRYGCLYGKGGEQRRGEKEGIKERYKVVKKEAKLAVTMAKIKA